MTQAITKIICITCPVGCSLEVTHKGKTITRVEGHECKKGLDYADVELTDPRRMVTSVVKVRGGVHPVIPVHTAAPIPKALIFDLLTALRQVELQAPAKIGQVVLENALDTSIDVMASRNLPAV